MSFDIKTPTKKFRNMSLEELTAYYSEEELAQLLPGTEEPVRDLSLKYDDKYEEAKRRARPKLHRWTPAELEFLENNYMYVSDSKIALALNIPMKKVRDKRYALGLMKTSPTDIDVIVWCDRDDFDRDIKTAMLTKARP